MQPASGIDVDTDRFFDGGDDVDEPQPSEPAKYELARVITDIGDGTGREVFRLRRRIGYCDRHVGELIVPADLTEFETDLTSVPAVFTWLVPKSGDHLPAALIHDGLVRADGTPPEHLGPDVSRVEADRIFRDAMADSGTGVIRRWIVWAAVTLATMWNRQGTGSSSLARNYHRWVMVATLVTISWLGYQATADLANRSGSWPCSYELFWIVGDSVASEFWSGVAGAIVIPLLISVLWGRFWRAGAIAGVMLGALFHVSLALLVLSAIYVVAEAIVSHGVDGLRRIARDLARSWPGIAAGAAAVVAIIVVC